jgi:hypothetical protein
VPGARASTRSPAPSPAGTCAPPPTSSAGATRRQPDSLADHAEVVGAAADFEDRTVFYEDANYCASDAYERITGDCEAFYEAWRQYAADRPETRAETDMGEDFDFDDDDEMRRRLPRLALLFLSEKAVDRTPTGS